MNEFNIIMQLLPGILSGIAKVILALNKSKKRK